jgi:hypothetical protein
MTIPADVCLLVADYGLGDHYIVGAMADAVRRQYGVRVWLGGRVNLSFVAGLYPAVERYVELPPGREAAKADAWKIEGGKIFYAHFPELELMRAVGYNGFHFLDAYRCRLGLPVDAAMTRPRQPTAAELAAAGQLLGDNGFTPGRTVVLSIEARTTPTDGVDLAFWIQLAGELRQQGLDVLVNAGPTTRIPEGLKSLGLPLAALRPVVQSAGFFCSVRSGMSDLLCDLRCPQVVVYPDVQYWAGSLLAGTTFNRFGLTRVPHEIVVKAGYSTDEVRAIAEYLGARLSRPVPMAGAA